MLSGNGWPTGRSKGARIAVRIDRLAGGNFGDSKPIGEGLHELGTDWGPGYRVYYGKIETACVLLLCRGDKLKQPAEIKKARVYSKDYKKTTEVE
jgi:putative addiction module killer protein